MRWAMVVIAGYLGACAPKPPQAALSGPSEAALGSEVMLDASASQDPNNPPDALSFDWQWLSRPEASRAELRPSEGRARFSPDIPGFYSARVTVRREKAIPAYATMTVNVRPLLGLPVYVGQRWAEARALLKETCEYEHTPMLEIGKCKAPVSFGPLKTDQLVVIAPFGKTISGIFMHGDAGTCEEFGESWSPKLERAGVPTISRKDEKSEGRVEIAIRSGRDDGVVVTAKCLPGVAFFVSASFAWTWDVPEGSCPSMRKAPPVVRMLSNASLVQLTRGDIVDPGTACNQVGHLVGPVMEKTLPGRVLDSVARAYAVWKTVPSEPPDWVIEQVRDTLSQFEQSRAGTLSPASAEALREFVQGSSDSGLLGTVWHGLRDKAEQP